MCSLCCLPIKAFIFIWLYDSLSCAHWASASAILHLDKAFRRTLVDSEQLITCVMLLFMWTNNHFGKHKNIVWTWIVHHLLKWLNKCRAIVNGWWYFCMAQCDTMWCVANSADKMLPRLICQYLLIGWAITTEKHKYNSQTSCNILQHIKVLLDIIQTTCQFSAVSIGSRLKNLWLINMIVNAWLRPFLHDSHHRHRKKKQKEIETLLDSSVGNNFLSVSAFFIIVCSMWKFISLKII